jgi:hypothetical protein
MACSGSEKDQESQRIKYRINIVFPGLDKRQNIVLGIRRHILCQFDVF